MRLNNSTLGRLERLQLLGCPVVIRAGQPHATVIGLAVARFNSILHALRVRSLRRYWREDRAFDRKYTPAPHLFWESYMILRFQAREVLPARWLNRV
jgi:hypothetical protein